MAICKLTDCPGTTLNQPHQIGDNACGYLNALPDPRPKNTGSPTSCRRPFCTKEFMTKDDRDKHEVDGTKHRKRDMDFICDYNGHIDAIAEHRFCPVCQ